MSPKEVAFIPYYCVIICLSEGGAGCPSLIPVQHRPLVGHQVSYLNIQFETKYLSNLINHSHSCNWLAEVDGWMQANQLRSGPWIYFTGNIKPDNHLAYSGYIHNGMF